MMIVTVEELWLMNTRLFISKKCHDVILSAGSSIDNRGQWKSYGQ